MSADRPRPPGYGDSLESLLEAIGSAEGAAGSGSAAALALSAGIECLALHVELTERSDQERTKGEELASLRERVGEWREVVRRSFTDDAVVVGRIVDARRERDRSVGDERTAAVEREVAALEEATSRLLELIDIARAVCADAERMVAGQGVAYARSESATARALGQAAATALTAMVDANVETLRRRCERYGVGGGRVGLP